MKLGERVADRFEIEDLAGVGGMSSVFRARDTRLERLVALKILHEHYSDDPEYVERFRREAQAIARLSHPNIVTVIDRGEWEGRQFIVFEHVPGRTLKTLVEERGRLPVVEALVLAHQTARGLAWAHEHGIVHRDVKPQNVLVDDEGTAKVTDFGIARSGDREAGLTQTGTVLGTSDYISPEQVEGRPVDERSDQYSLGVLLYELLTGELPYPADGFLAVALRHVRDPVPSVRDLRPDVSPRLDALVSRAMAKQPEKRFPTTETMIAALEACLAEERAHGASTNGATAMLPALAPAPATAARGSRSPWPLVAAAVFVLAMLAGAWAATREDGRETAAPPPAAEEAPAGEAAAPAAEIELAAVRDFDPHGDGREHPEAIERATDGDPSTYWTTETYRSFDKPGVGLVLDAGEPRALRELALASDLPGFTAEIHAGASPEGPFEAVSESRTVEAETAFELDTGGRELRYYLVWITDPNRRAHVNGAIGR